jgi:hypothetical protein
MAKHNERSSVTGRFTPKAAVDEVLEQTAYEPQPEGVYYAGMARHTGRVDVDSAYLPGEYRDPISKYQYGPQDTRVPQTLFERANPMWARARKAILIDAETGQRLDERIVQVEQPDQVSGNVPPRLREVQDHRFMSKRTFGHLDQDGE